jgi:hypothetical protein
MSLYAKGVKGKNWRGHLIREKNKIHINFHFFVDFWL